jgi:hypothetical protein
MRNLAITLTMLVALAGCQGPQSGVTSVPGHGAVTVTVQPNPIVATKVSGNTYDFPFDVIVRETGGRATTVQRITARVFLGGGITLANESWDAAAIRAMGYNPVLGPNTEQHYHFNPRKDVPDERLFNGVSAELRVEAVDDTGTAANSTTVVTVTR